MLLRAGCSVKLNFKKKAKRAEKKHKKHKKVHGRAMVACVDLTS